MGLFKELEQIKNDNVSFSFRNSELEKMFKDIFNDDLIKLKKLKKNKKNKEKQK